MLTSAAGATDVIGHAHCTVAESPLKAHHHQAYRCVRSAADDFAWTHTCWLPSTTAKHQHISWQLQMNLRQAAVQDASVMAVGNGQGAVQLLRLAGPLGRRDELALQPQQPRLQAVLQANALGG